MTSERDPLTFFSPEPDGHYDSDFDSPISEDHLYLPDKRCCSSEANISMLRRLVLSFCIWLGSYYLMAVLGGSVAFYRFPRYACGSAVHVMSYAVPSSNYINSRSLNPSPGNQPTTLNLTHCMMLASSCYQSSAPSTCFRCCISISRASCWCFFTLMPCSGPASACIVATMQEQCC